MKKPTADQTVRNLKPHIILYLEKEVPVSTETTFSDLFVGSHFWNGGYTKSRTEKKITVQVVYIWRPTNFERSKKEMLFFFWLKSAYVSWYCKLHWLVLNHSWQVMPKFTILFSNPQGWIVQNILFTGF